MEERKFCLEVCVDSLDSARAAIEGGADRLELCACLMVGGLTPEGELLEQIRQESQIPVRCLMRPRFGDFLYTAAEVERMAKQMERLSRLGADGFVIGCLTEDGDLDIPKVKTLIAAAGGKGITLHRAFDVSREGLDTAWQAAELGVDTILTSGQAADCRKGQAYIGRLVDAGLPLTIMPGGGVHAGVIRELKERYGLTTFHMSGKVVKESAMVFRREGVPMGLPGFDEFTLWQTDPEQVRQAALALRG